MNGEEWNGQGLQGWRVVQPADQEGPTAPSEAVIGQRVSLEAEIPEPLFDGMREFIRNHPHWDQYQLVSSALACFLFQNGCTDACVTQHYLDGLFLRNEAD